MLVEATPSRTAPLDSGDTHPLDPLNSAEINAVASIVRTNCDLGVGSRFETIVLDEPVPDELARYEGGTPVDRRAFVALYDATTGDLFEVVVSLKQATVVSRTHRPGARPRISEEEMLQADQMICRDPRFVAALQRRGITDLSLVCTDVWSASVLGDPIEQERRLVHAFVWVRTRPFDNQYARPVEGLTALVDVDRWEVVRICDHGVVPLGPMNEENYAARFQSRWRADIKPIEVAQPLGPSFSVTGNSVTWCGWRFRVGYTPREGLVLHDLSIRDGGTWRRLIRRAALAEMMVPYGSPNGSHPHAQEVVRFHDFLKQTNTDGLVILKGGELIFEYYDNGLDATSPHILMSVSKSLIGLLSGILVQRGHFLPGTLISDVLPEIATTAYTGATIRDLLDMRAGIYFDENYLAASGPIIAYRKATNWNALEPGDTPSDLRSFFQEIKQAIQPHGGPFNYVSPNTDLLGWVIERSTGRRCADLISELLWRPIRASRSAYITVDRLGALRCAGGICATVRDLARVGQLVAQSGALEGDQIVPCDWITDIAVNGDQAAWLAAAFAQCFSEKSMHYRSQWYALTDGNAALFALGIHGQWLFVDRGRNIVIAKVSSQNEPLDPQRITLTISAFRAMREFLG